jgi:hypothetical protein
MRLSIVLTEQLDDWLARADWPRQAMLAEPCVERNVQRAIDGGCPARVWIRAGTPVVFQPSQFATFLVLLESFLIRKVGKAEITRQVIQSFVLFRSANSAPRP